MKRIELLKRIQEIYTKLENDSLDSSEIDELVDLSNKLYERALILRYKVAEQRIFGENNELQTKDIADNTDDLAVVDIKETELPETIDFSIFEEKEDEILENEEFIVEEEPIVEEVPVSEPVENILNFHDTIDEPIIKEESIQSLVEEEIVEPEPEPESEPEQLEEPKIELVDTEWSTYFNKVLSAHSSGIQKPLDSLAGSFGLNERILYINELFNGDAEKFSNAILQLDKILDWNDSVITLTSIASEENWDNESDTVGEFVVHVNRKHA
ncbi:MAG: hypothetical protein ACSHXL_06800 [Bacteroidota bacterium]